MGLGREKPRGRLRGRAKRRVEPRDVSSCCPILSCTLSHHVVARMREDASSPCCEQLLADPAHATQMFIERFSKESRSPKSSLKVLALPSFPAVGISRKCGSGQGTHQESAKGGLTRGVEICCVHSVHLSLL